MENNVELLELLSNNPLTQSPKPQDDFVLNLNMKGAAGKSGASLLTAQLLWGTSCPRLCFPHNCWLSWVTQVVILPFLHSAR